MWSPLHGAEHDGHLSAWQEAVGHEIILDAHKNGCANEATTGLTLGLFVVLFQDVVFGRRECGGACRSPYLVLRALIRTLAVGPDEAGFWPVINNPSVTTWTPQFLTLE